MDEKKEEERVCVLCYLMAPGLKTDNWCQVTFCTFVSFANHQNQTLGKT